MSFVTGSQPNFASGAIGGAGLPSLASHDGGLSAGSYLQAGAMVANAVAGVASDEPQSIKAGSVGKKSGATSSINFGGSGASLDFNSILVLAGAAVLALFVLKGKK